MELAKMTSKGQLTIPASIRKLLGAKTGDQILFYEKDGRIIIAAANPSSLADAQIAAAENHVYSLKEIRQIVTPIAEKYKVQSVRLFGSYARNEAGPKSDLDFVIERGELKSLLQIGGFQEDLAEAFRKKIDIVAADSLSDDFKKRIQSYEVSVYVHP